MKKTCADKAYTVQDQKAAGCTGADTVDQCAAKLYKHCVATASTPGFNLDLRGGPPIPGNPNPNPGIHTPGFSTQEYLQTAQATAARARALSQMLNQYAFQVEQNAKALAPAPVRAK